MQNYIVPGNLLQAVANYLATKPYNEVANIIAELGKCPVAPPDPATIATKEG